MLVYVTWDTDYIGTLIYFQHGIIVFFITFFSLGVYELAQMKKSSMKLQFVFLIIPVIFTIFCYVPQLRHFMFTYDIGKYAKGQISSDKNTILYIIFLTYALLLCSFMASQFYIIIKKPFINFTSQSMLLLIVLIVATLFTLIAINSQNYQTQNLIPMFITLLFYVIVKVKNQYTFDVLQNKVKESFVDEDGSLVFVYDTNGYIIFANKQLLDIFKVEKMSIIGYKVTDFNRLSKYFGEVFYNIINKNYTTDQYMVENTAFKIQNIESYSRKNPTNHEFTVFIFTDVTKEFNVNNQIHKAINTDILTDFKNRFNFESSYDSSFNFSSQNVALIIVDLDNLKIINDLFGYESGDIIITTLSGILKSVFFHTKHEIYRLDGDEFCIIVEDRKEFEVKELISRLYEKSSTFNSNNLLQLLFSVGCVFKSEILKDVTSMYKFADISMNKSKIDGKNRATYFSDSIHEEFILQSKLTDELESAIFQGGITLFLQPKLNVSSNSFDRAEALVRWNHKELGLLYPNSFLGIAKNLKLISYIDFLILEKSCKILEKWKKINAKKITISINLSVESLFDIDLSKKVMGIVDKYDISPDQISFEIAENKIGDEFTDVKKNISLLKEKGIIFAIDNFGKGSSNFESIANFNADSITIDKTIVDKSTTAQKHQDNIALLCNLLRSYDCELVAKGVETLDQVDILNNLDIDYSQGFFFSEPLAIDKFEEKYIMN